MKLEVGQIEGLAAQSTTVTALIRKIGMQVNGTNHDRVREFIEEHGIELAKKGPTLVRTKKLDDEIFVENSTYTNNNHIKARLVKDHGFANRCSMDACENPEPFWAGKPLTLQLDHINGVNNDNRMWNLRIICPNCHTQTPTFGSRNRKTLDQISERTCECGGSKSRRSARCVSCHKEKVLVSSGKIEWPPVVELVQMVRDSNFSQVSKKLGVSDNAIRKHLKARGVDYKTM